jgi:predicted RNase H-like nuclease (RuvC/YqgF family)
MEKIPIEFLLKYSRQEVGELKAEIDELNFIIKEKDKEIAKLNKKVKKYQDLTKQLSPTLQVNRNLSNILHTWNNIKTRREVKREKKRIQLYKRVSKYYNAWYEGCKILLSVLKEIRTTDLNETPE